jgi:cyclopropane fatty-acyl-phospholipid synthase-like methyltransferase
MTKLEEPHNILDVGTGTGIWAIEAGDLYPSAAVTGVDLSPIQPNWMPVSWNEHSAHTLHTFLPITSAA